MLTLRVDGKGVLWIATLPLLLLVAYAYIGASNAMMFLAAAAVLIAAAHARDVADPRCWFVAVAALYSFAGPLLALLQGRTLSKAEFAAVYLHEVAIFAFVIGASITLVRPARASSRWWGRDSERFRAAGLAIGTLLFVLSVAAVALALRAPHLSKMVLALERPIWWRAQALISVFLTCVFIVFVASRGRSAHVPHWLWPLAAWFLVLAIVSGERDIVIRYCVCALIATHLFYTRLAPARLVLVGCALVITLGALGINRSNGGRSLRLSERIVEQSLGGEFEASWHNTAVVVSARESRVPVLPAYNTIVADIAQTFGSIGFFTQRSERRNGSAWFNRTFHPGTYERGGGRGFSLVGELYVNGGTIAVLAGFAVLGLVLATMRRMTQHPLFMLAYCLAIPGVTYALRMDVATLLSYTIKQVGFTFLLLILVARVLPEPKPIQSAVVDFAAALQRKTEGAALSEAAG